MNTFVVGTLVRDEDFLLEGFRDNIKDLKWIALDTGSDSVETLLSLADIVYRTEVNQSPEVIDFRAINNALFHCCHLEGALRVVRLCPDELLTVPLLEHLDIYANDPVFDAVSCNRVEYCEWMSTVDVKTDFWVMLPSHARFESSLPAGLHE
ncbi:MAG: hypothetical protein KKD44_27675, partial [Proteobacteria bacterium]|nr:hypothetical protein [Pseudomonadota bacterium]